MVSSESLLSLPTRLSVAQVETLEDFKLTWIAMVVILDLCIVLLAARATLLPYAVEVPTNIH
jgi:hypothetical protein